MSCKDSGHVVRISHAKSGDHDVWPTSPRPVFVAVHPTSGDVYAGLDKSSRIFRLEAKSGKTSEMAIDPAMGSTPVGVVRGADGNVWFVLLGDKTGGSGTFGRIGADGAITWFHLGNMTGMHAGLIHLGFGEPEGDGPATLYLLGSTMAAMMALDAVFAVTFDPGHTRIATVQTVAMATPMCMTHRVLPMGGDVFVTAMVCALTHDFGVGQPAQRVVYT